MNELWWLNLGVNNLGTGDASDISFVDSLTNCTKLQILSSEGNGFGGNLLNSITDLSTQLIRLSATGNQFVGNTPADISKFVNLFSLRLGHNLFSGSIPSSIGKLQYMQLLFLAQNRLFGSIPESIGNLTQLFSVTLEEKNMTGSLPPSLINIPGLQILRLSRNNLIGFLPKTIGRYSVLYYISLTHNSFNGVLYYISLTHNSFNGSLPLELGTLTNLQVLDISDNNFSGDIPTTLESYLKLENLLLSSNSFHGSIPSSLASLKGLVVLDLSRNLSGPIPIDLDKLSVLEQLNLSYNNLEGEMPLKGAFTNISVILISRNMNLYGGVPELHLPACTIKEFTKQNNHLGPKVIIIIISVGLFLVILMSVVAIYWKRKPRKASSTTALGEELLRVSYYELFKATDGFSSDNLLGVGSFDSVYEGVLHQNKKPIAVKVFNLDHLGGPKSFIECEALRKTRHRNLFKIITACSSINFEGNDFKALVFEFMQHESLESWLHPSEDTTRKLNLTQRLNITINVVSALEYLHHTCETQVIHCDLKPSNVLLDEDMIAHVGDFGLAKFLTSDISNPFTGQTNSIAINGSIGYVAPKYGMGELVSTQGDIYSYEILLLEMLTGKRPTDEMLTGKRPTDEMFKDGLNLHSFCKTALPDNLMEIVDSHMVILEEELNDQTNRNRNAENEAKTRECLTSLVRVGVACSTKVCGERMCIGEVMKELNAIKQVLLSVGIHGERPKRMHQASKGTSQLNNV